MTGLLQAAIGPRDTPDDEPDDTARETAADGYRAQAIGHLQHRMALDALMIAMLDGSQPATIAEFNAVDHAQGLCAKAAGEALFCLGALLGSEGTA